jgi:DNA adenine methylase
MGDAVKTILKYQGSKWSIAQWIISNFPSEYEKMTYLEPFFGSGAIFFNKKRSVVETINDLDGNVVNLFNVIREQPEELARLIEFTPWSREEYSKSYTMTGENLEDARRFLVRMWQAIGAKSSDITGWRSNIKALNGNVPQWSTKLPQKILDASWRLKHFRNFLVQIENRPAVDCITRYNRNNVFIYADPPYIRSTRSGRIYACEMNDQDHIELLELLKKHSGKIMLSGYESELYNDLLQGWHTEKLMAKCEGGQVRQEVLWMNYKPQNQMSLF